MAVGINNNLNTDGMLSLRSERVHIVPLGFHYRGVKECVSVVFVCVDWWGKGTLYLF